MWPGQFGLFSRRRETAARAPSVAAREPISPHDVAGCGEWTDDLVEDGSRMAGRLLLRQIPADAA